MSYTLHTAPGQFRSFKALIAAEYNGIDVTVETEKADSASSLSPTGKLPILQTPSGAVLFESNAIARHLAKLRRDAGLTGNGNVFEEASIDAWVDFGSNELELPCCVWWYAAAGYMPFDEVAYNKAKADLAAALKTLDSHLKGKKYLVGDHITLADICIASTLVYPMKFVCDKAFLKPYGNVVRWFQACVNQPQFKAVIGEVALCKTELTAAGKSSS